MGASVGTVRGLGTEDVNGDASLGGGWGHGDIDWNMEDPKGGDEVTPGDMWDTEGIARGWPSDSRGAGEHPGGWGTPLGTPGPTEGTLTKAKVLAGDVAEVLGVQEPVPGATQELSPPVAQVDQDTGGQRGRVTHGCCTTRHLGLP